MMHLIDWNSDTTLEWRHNDRQDVSNHRHIDWLLKRLFMRTPKITRKEFPFDDVTIKRWKHEGVFEDVIL